MDTLLIRLAGVDDQQRIVEIYNQAVDEKYCTGDTEHICINSRLEWFKQHASESYPIFVAEIEALVVGWCSLSPYRPGRKALRRTAEISYYFDRSFRGRGLGRQLVAKVMDEARSLGFNTLIAFLLDRNLASISLLEALGFTRWGHLPDIACFDEGICGQFIYGRKL